MNIVFGLIIAVVSATLVFKANWVTTTFGTIQWAESKLGSFGGTRMVLKTIGVFGVFIGFVVMTGQIDAFLNATLGWIVPGDSRGSL